MILRKGAQRVRIRRRGKKKQCIRRGGRIFRSKQESNSREKRTEKG